MLCCSVIRPDHYNDALNACHYYIDLLKKRGESVGLMEKVVDCVLTYSYVSRFDFDDSKDAPISVHCQVDQRYVPLFWEVGGSFDLDAKEAGYKVDYVAKLLEKRRLYIEQKRRERGERAAWVWEKWAEFLNDHAGQGRVTKKAFAESIDMNYQMVCQILRS